MGISWGIFDIIFWKGIWDGTDHLAGCGLWQALTTASLGLIILCLTRRLKSAVSMPVGIAVDQEDDQIPCGTFLETNLKDPMCRRFLDGLLSRVIEAGVVLIWHGIWSLMDVITE